MNERNQQPNEPGSSDGQPAENAVGSLGRNRQADRSSENTPDPQDAQQWKERYLRLLADLDNTKKHLERNAVQRIEGEKDSLLRDLLPLADNLERVLRHETSESACQRIRDGVALTLHDFQNVLAKHGVKKIEALGQPFNPDFHEARGIVQKTEIEEGIIVEVLLNGYMREVHLLRPAQVLVSAG